MHIIKDWLFNTANWFLDPTLRIMALGTSKGNEDKMNEGKIHVSDVWTFTRISVLFSVCLVSVSVLSLFHRKATLGHWFLRNICIFGRTSCHTGIVFYISTTRLKFKCTNLEPNPGNGCRVTELPTLCVMCAVLCYGLRFSQEHSGPNQCQRWHHGGSCGQPDLPEQR